MRFFDNPIMSTYAVTVADASSGAVAARIQGPPGSRGMVQAISTHITTEVTTTADVVQFGVSGTAAKYGTYSVAAAAAGAVQSATRTELENIDWLEADTVIEISDTGASDAGVFIVYVTVAWERKYPRP